MRYQIFQLKSEYVHELGFRPMNEVKVSCFNYHMVYEGEVDKEYNTEPCDYVLERLFRIFNVERPEDFKGWSVSIGDIILLEGYGAFYVDRWGFCKVESWGK